MGAYPKFHISLAILLKLPFDVFEMISFISTDFVAKLAQAKGYWRRPKEMETNSTVLG